MLNVNAKAFVPQSIGDRPVVNANTIYRYHLMLSRERVCDVSDSSSGSNGIMTLLARRWLCACPQGGPGEEPLQMFITAFFDTVENVSHPINGSNIFTGLLLSRTILSLSGFVSTINDINNASGFLIRIDIQREYRAEVAPQLRSAWDDFFETFRGDSRFSCLGYVGSSCGSLTSKRYGGTYRHYFFISSASLKSELETLSIKHFTNSPFSILRVTEVNAVVPFVCNPRIPIAVVISVGETAKEKLLSEGKSDEYFCIPFHPFDVSKTLQNFKEYEEFFLSLLKEEKYLWNRTYILHIDIKIQETSLTKIQPIPIWDVVQFICNLCDDTATGVLGVCFSDGTLPENTKLGNEEREDKACYLNTTLQSLLEKSYFLDNSNLCIGGIPNHIKRPIKISQYEYVRNKIEEILLEYREPTILTRMVFAEVANNFAKEKYFVRNRSVGESILLLTDDQGDIFTVDIRSGSISALPNCFGGIVSPVRNSIFKATISSSFRGYLEYIILLEDVLIFEGINMSEKSFTERWQNIEKTILDDQNNRPHVNMDHIIIVRNLYLPFEQAEQVLKSPPLEYPTLGLVFIPQVSKGENGIFSSYSWIPPESITAKFLAGKVDNIEESNGEVKRAWLYVKDQEEKIISYNEEYVDYLVDSYHLLKTGSIIECILQRSSDGAHWWELLKDLGKNNGKKAETYENIDKLVHTPGLTHEEMLWLLKASTYKCGRCHNVSDIGKINPRYQVYWCQNCWEETGHGECVYCGLSCTIGRIDRVSKRFYCDICWEIFYTTNTNAEIGYLVPPPPNASFATQVLTRSVALLIDAINPKAPTNDVLDICCGGSVTRKWIKNKSTRYVGFDLKSSVVESTTELINSLRDELPENSSYDVICADAFSKDLWTQHITKIHPRQFHSITVFAGLHHAFDSENKARHVIGSIANALVPRGVFFGCFLDASTLFGRNENSNDLFTAEWEEDFLPRVGHHFSFSIQGGPKKKINVVAIDFLVAVARDYGFDVMPEVCLTFREILENDPNFTKVFSKSEKEYLSAMRTFAFRKDGEPLPRAPCKTNGKNEE
ncbi:mRNA (guanine-N(7))-methyltransferase domain [Trypanosoma melophagium]|uniref:mRNA (guanine-N(7))-methyltransferase domain n=1 Tax=Trypanosoma melophagium TaxID=715481 RepID=UPI00351A122F|nr:mRNA (guanine-N(7))-methyltransferase domain [Trypanosoma melophagium]